MPSRLRSRQQKWTRVSRPASRSRIAAAAALEMRADARGPSGRLTASAPASRSRRAAPISLVMSGVRGGSSSIETGHSVFASARPKAERTASGSGSLASSRWRRGWAGGCA